MEEVVTSIKRVNDIMSEIAAASAEQACGIEEVSKAVVQMDEMTQQNAALVEEAAAAAESLQQQAGNLSERVSTFNIGETRPAVSDSDDDKSELRHLFYCSGTSLEPFLPNFFPKGISGQE